MYKFDRAKTRHAIYSEIISNDQDVAASFMKWYGTNVEEFTELMTDAMRVWNNELVSKVEQDENIRYVVNITHCAIVLHMQSMKLFLSGHIIAAGNLSRQVIEAIALALLCSHNELDILNQFVQHKYSTTKAMRDVQRHLNVLGLSKEALKALADSEKFYHSFSHFSIMTIGSFTSFSQNMLYVGASFEENKINEYHIEVERRVNLAKIFPNFIAGVAKNIAMC